MRIGSLFSGIGGLELGLEWAGVGQTVWQVEIDPFCRSVLAKHWPDAQRFDDVHTVGGHNLPAVDVICGGFPCQDISSAGKKAGLGGAKSSLWLEMLRVFRELTPNHLVIENVSTLAHRGLDEIFRSLSEIGYRGEYSVLSACSLGAPFTRARLFVIAHADGNGKPALSVNAEASDLRSPSRRPWNWWADPIAVARAHIGLSGRMDRNRALGNAVVPQVAEVVGRRLLQIDAELRGVAL